MSVIRSLIRNVTFEGKPGCSLTLCRLEASRSNVTAGGKAAPCSPLTPAGSRSRWQGSVHAVAVRVRSVSTAFGDRPRILWATCGEFTFGRVGPLRGHRWPPGSRVWVCDQSPTRAPTILPQACARWKGEGSTNIVLSPHPAPISLPSLGMCSLF